MGNTLLFTYGTLRRGESNSHILNTTSKYLKTVKTIKKFIMITTEDAFFPYLILPEYWPEMQDKAIHITGDIYNITSAGIALCDELEGHPTWYIRTNIQTISNTGEVNTVQAYILTRESWDIMLKDNLIVLDGDWKHIKQIS
jgi:gamma-glutamylcyclotransferase (GGCT)/AIG2-like uncharacterized protein YtfP